MFFNVFKMFFCFCFFLCKKESYTKKDTQRKIQHRVKIEPTEHHQLRYLAGSGKSLFLMFFNVFKMFFCFCFFFMQK